MNWLDYEEKNDWPDDKIVLLELVDRVDGRIKYQTATINNGSIMVIGGHFHFDMKEIYHIARYCLIDKP